MRQDILLHCGERERHAAYRLFREAEISTACDPGSNRELA